MKKIVFVISLTMVWLLSSQGLAATDHTSLITTYEGSKTCRGCHVSHDDAVDDLIGSLHYRLLGQTQGVYDYLTNKELTGEYGKGNRY